MKVKKINCLQCGNKISVLLKEYNRQVKAGRNPDKFFCNCSCSMSYSNLNPSVEYKPIRNDRLAKSCILRNTNRFSSDYSYLVKNIRARKLSRDVDLDIDADFFAQMFAEQGGLCAISSVAMSLRKWKGNNTPYTASADRIDSSIGYKKENVQLVCYSVNLAKNNFSQECFGKFMADLKGG